MLLGKSDGAFQLLGCSALLCSNFMIALLLFRMRNVYSVVRTICRAKKSKEEEGKNPKRRVTLSCGCSRVHPSSDLRRPFQNEVALSILKQSYYSVLNLYFMRAWAVTFPFPFLLIDEADEPTMRICGTILVDIQRPSGPILLLGGLCVKIFGSYLCEKWE